MRFEVACDRAIRIEVYQHESRRLVVLDVAWPSNPAAAMSAVARPADINCSSSLHDAERASIRIGSNIPRAGLVTRFAANACIILQPGHIKRGRVLEVHTPKRTVCRCKV